MTGVWRRKSSAYFLLAWLLVAAQLAGGLLVLCVSAEGHVEVETVGSPCCIRALAGASGMSIGADDSACSGCADAALLTSAGGPSSNPGVAGTLPAARLAAASTAPLAPIGRLSRDSARPPLFAASPSLSLRC